MDNKEFDLHNHQCIADFLENTRTSDSDITGSIKTTIAQFLMNFRLRINKRARELGRNWLSADEIIDCQVSELRQCIIDLETYKEILIKGETVQ